MSVRSAKTMLPWVIATVIFLPLLAQADTYYVTDKFEITLRSGPSGSHKIQRMLTSGTVLEVIERDADSGYSKVRTRAGHEGWVLSRYLITEPVARTQLESLTSALTNTSTKGNNIGWQVDTIKHTLDSAAKQVALLQDENEKLKNEITEIKQLAANTLAIDSQNKQLRSRLVSAESQKNILLQENQELSSYRDRDWFIAGAVVLFAGMIFGIIVTRIRWRKRSRYESF